MMRRLLDAINRDVVALTRTALFRRTAQVETVDHASDPPRVTVRYKPTDQATPTIDVYGHVPVDVGDTVDVDAAPTSRPRVRGVVTAPQWHDLELAGVWAAHGSGHPTLRWRFEPGRVLRLHGAVTGGTGTIGTLPDHAHPTSPSRAPAVGNGAFAVVEVAADGVVSLVSGSGTALFVDTTVPL